MTALHRHRAHIASTLSRAEEARELLHQKTLTEQVQGLVEEAHRLRSEAKRRHDIRAALRGIDVALRAIEVLAKLSGQIQSSTQFQVGVAIGGQQLTSHDIAAVERSRRYESMSDAELKVEMGRTLRALRLAEESAPS